LDQRFVDIYKATRTKVVERQKQIALIVIQDDDLLFYREGHALERFSGLMPPLYNKMKTLGHMPLGVFCLLHDHTGTTLPQDVLEEAKTYRDMIKAAAGALDTQDDAKAGALPAPSPIYAKVTAFLDGVIAEGRVSHDGLAAFARSVAADLEPVLTAAAHAQIDACNKIVTHIRDDLLNDTQWRDVRVLVLGPYMAKTGEIFLQYFAHLLHAWPQGDHRIVYFEGDDLPQAIDRLGTTMLDGIASRAIFGERQRLHRDVLADATKEYLQDLTKGLA
ncbi:MAG: hypothetical protein R3D01_14330, partial [Hyphomicrobiales bacterium]